MLTINNLCKSYGDKTLFNNINFYIDYNNKSAIIGNNGTGKSTILKIIVGEINQDKGNIYLEKGKKIGYLPQDAEFISNFDLLHSVVCINNEITNSLIKLYNIDSNNLNNNNLALQYAEANANFENYGGYKLIERAKKILKILGFTEEEYSYETKFLSGGQKTRALLCKLLLSDCDLLLLDEPTNHLDYEAQEFFVKYLNNDFRGAYLIVSHDRYFLNQVVNKIYELDNTSLYEYNGNYDEYLNIKKQNEITTSKIIEKNKKAIAKMENSVQTLFSHRNFSGRDNMLKKLDKIKSIANNYNLSNKKTMSIKLEQNSQSGTTLLKFDKMSKAFDGKILFDNIDLNIERGQKIGIVGPNGSGKSTFIKIINGIKTADSGQLTYGHNVKMEYFAQEFESLDLNKNIFDELLYDTNLSSKETQDLLAKFLFIGDDIFKLVKDLSGGEKCRLALAKIMANKPNLLLLDEPTNHLDISSCEILENAIIDYDGTVIIVSHDRYFLNKTTNLTIEIKNGKFTKYFGNYSYYKEKSLKLFNQNTINNKIQIKTRKRNNRDIRLEIKPLSIKIKQIENNISETEKEISILSEKLGDETIYKNGEAKRITKEYKQNQDKLKNLMVEWETLQGKIDILTNELK